MNYIIKTKEIEIDGMTYIVETYSNGAIVKRLKSSEDVQFIEPVSTQLDRIEAAVLQSKQDIIDEYTLELLESGVL